MDPDFPLSELDILVKQCNITINFLRAARSNPKLSAYAYLNYNFQTKNGTNSFNSTTFLINSEMNNK